MPELPRQSDGLLCKRCDVYVGMGGLGVVEFPTDVHPDQVNRICWVCRRTEDEIREEQAAMGRQSDGDEPEIPAEVLELVAAATRALQEAEGLLDRALGVGGHWPWNPLAVAADFTASAVRQLEPL